MTHRDLARQIVTSTALYDDDSTDAIEAIIAAHFAKRDAAARRLVETAHRLITASESCGRESYLGRDEDWGKQGPLSPWEQAEAAADALAALMPEVTP